MTTRRARVLAATGVTCAGGTQVAAGMVGSPAWQWVFLVITVVTTAAGTWVGSPGLEKS